VNLALLISEAPPVQSGLARIADRLCAGLRKAGHRVDVVSTREAGRIAWGELRVTGLLPRWPRLAALLSAADAVLVFGATPTFSDLGLCLLGLRRRRPALVYVHVFDLDLPGLRGPCEAYNGLKRRLASLADRVVVATPDYAEGFERRGAPGRVQVIPWGIDVPEAEPAPKPAAPFTAAFIGQLRPYKGVRVLLEAARALPELRFLLAGEGPERPALEARIRRFGLANLELVGALSEDALDALYRRAHAVVLPSVSRLEAFGIVLVEGMARGCVPVASSLPGVRQVVDEIGLCFPPGDAGALAAALRRLAADPRELARRARAARERSRAYAWERTVEGYVALCESLQPAGRGGRGAP
jgi:glycosyltransferase involved in cell wall biosynthesis